MCGVNFITRLWLLVHNSRANVPMNLSMPNMLVHLSMFTRLFVVNIFVSRLQFTSDQGKTRCIVKRVLVVTMEVVTRKIGFNKQQTCFIVFLNKKIFTRTSK